MILLASCHRWPAASREQFIAGCTKPYGNYDSCSCVADYLEDRVAPDTVVLAMDEYNAGRHPDPQTFATIQAAVRYCGL